MSSAKKWQGRLVNLSLVVVSVVLTLVAAEFVLRLTDIGVKRSGVWDPPHPAQTDSLRGRYLRPGYEGTVTSKDFRFAVRANSEGFRERELPRDSSDARDIVFIGDSFFFGHGVDQAYRFSEQLTSLLDEYGLESYRVWNLAHPGSGTLDEMRTLQVFHERFSQPHVFLGFFIGNDFVKPRPARSKGEATMKQSQKVRRLLRTSRLFNVVFTNLWSIQWFRSLFSKLEMKNDRIVIYERDGGAWQEKVYQATEGMLAELATFCRSNDLALTVVLIPDHLQVLYPETYEDLDLLKPQRRLKKTLSERGVPVIDLYDTFVNDPDPGALMFTWDKHWNEQGHAVVAHEIVRYLAEKDST